MQPIILTPTLARALQEQNGLTAAALNRTMKKAASPRLNLLGVAGVLMLGVAGWMVYRGNRRKR